MIKNHFIFFYSFVTPFLQGCSSARSENALPAASPVLDKAYFKQYLTTTEGSSVETLVLSTVNGFKNEKVHDRGPGDRATSVLLWIKKPAAPLTKSISLYSISLMNFIYTGMPVMT
ncbi:MAG: hypothetical protein ACI89Z_000524 [Porticoccus sp.]|jgi:hypothetical protein